MGQYRGRFAPSPTGLLHFGSLLAAVASYADAKHNNGTWLLRIDDIDPPRAMHGATTQIPQTLQTYGFKWDDGIVLQSTRTQAYTAALNKLNALARLYCCQCSRSQLGSSPVYPGHCKPASTGSQSTSQTSQHVHQKLTSSDNDHAIRVLMEDDVTFDDTIQGMQQFKIGKDFGDTVVVRRDELFSYALCCAIDDATDISHVVRGYDLLPTTATQLGIMKLLDLTPPQYAHIPIAINTDEQKLSKQTHATPIDTMPVLPTLTKAWAFLGQTPVKASNVESFWNNALQQWRIDKIPKINAIPINQEGID